RAERIGEQLDRRLPVRKDEIRLAVTREEDGPRQLAEDRVRYVRVFVVRVSLRGGRLPEPAYSDLDGRPRSGVLDQCGRWSRRSKPSKRCAGIAECRRESNPRRIAA